MLHNFQKFHCLLLVCLMTGIAGVAEAGSVQFSTYYPAPFGMYDRLRLVPRAALGAPCDPGTLYIDSGAGNQLEVCNAAGNAWAPLSGGPWTQVGSNIYATDTTASVGIGTTTPAAKLHVSGGGIGLGIGLDNGNAISWKTQFGVMSNVLWMDGTDKTHIRGVGGGLMIDDGGGNPQVIVLNTGNVGIGTTTPANKLDVEGGMAVGATYSGTTAAPANGMIVEGNVGAGTTTPRTRLELGNDGAILATGTFASGWTEPNLGAGTRLLWYPRKAAFRAGSIPGTQWNDAQIGTYSIATGYNTTASGGYSTAMGVSGTASGLNSITIGSNTTASGQSSTAMGDGTTASGQSSTAMGNGTTASGGYSTAMGFYASAIGDLSTAMGYYTTANAYASLVLGQFNVGGGTPNGWVATDPLFVIGNGANAGSLSNALTVYKNGNTEVTGKLSALGGLVVETRTTNPAAPVAGQMWLCTDTGDATPCNGI